jgi:hypothetical protein
MSFRRKILIVVLMVILPIMSFGYSLSLFVSSGYLTGDDDINYSYFPPVYAGIKPHLAKLGGWGEFMGDISFIYLHNSKQLNDGGRSSISGLQMRALFVDVGFGIDFNIRDWLKMGVSGGFSGIGLRYNGFYNQEDRLNQRNKVNELWVEDNSLGFYFGGDVSFSVGRGFNFIIPVKYHFHSGGSDCFGYSVVSGFWQYYGVGVESLF